MEISRAHKIYIKGSGFALYALVSRRCHVAAMVLKNKLRHVAHSFKQQAIKNIFHAEKLVVLK